MPKFLLTKRFDSGSVAAGQTYENDWRYEKPAILHRIYIQSTDGADLPKSLFQLRVGGQTVTLDDAPLSIFGANILTNTPLDIDLPASTPIEFIFKNLEGAAKQVYITLELWTP